MGEQTIPAGYKQTEIGVIPEDWEVSSLRDVAFFGGGTTPPRKLHDRYYVSGLHPWVKTLDLNNNFIYVTEEYVTDAALSETSLRKQPAGTVLIAMYGGFNQIGRTGLLQVDAAINQALVAVIPKKGRLVSEYLLFNLNYQVEYWKGVASSSRKDPNITSNDVKNFLIPLPDEKEQTAIAKALSDVDALISEQEKLIAKKQAIKTATMQQLLTGKTRLPQFADYPDGTAKRTQQTELGEIPEDWEVKTVFELAEYQKSLFDDGDWIEAEHITNKGIRLIQTGNIGVGRYVEKDTKKYIFEESFEKLKCKELHEGDLLICRLAEPAGRACILPNIGEDKVITSVDVTIFRPLLEVVSREFYNQYFSSSDWFKSVLEQVGGTTHKRISRGALGRISVCYPNVEEQTAIAQILSDMDEEIQTLEQRLTKTRQIKQGMMQELLTGKIRLIEPLKEVLHE